MQVDLTTLFEDPRMMLLGVQGEVARFVPMNRENYERSIFFDRRLQPATEQFVQVPLGLLLDHLEKAPVAPPRLRFIHHFAHSGSTLLARALDNPANLVIREPAHLRQLGVCAGAGTKGLHLDLQKRLALSLAMLGKRFSSDSTVVVKGNAPISLLAQAIAEADPKQPAILLYFPLEDYCAAVLRTPNHRAWVERVTVEIALNDDPNVGDIAGLTVAETAAALWYSMIKRFEGLLERNPAMTSLDANQLFDRPADTVCAASKLLEAGLDAAEVEAIAKGPIFSTYSKNPNVPFDEAARRERRDQAKAALAGELRLARRWVEQRSGKCPLPAALERPLLGDRANLL